MSERFAHLHVHSDYSLLAGCGTMEQYAKVAQERGHPGIAFTEFGSMRGTSELIQIAKKHELKPVFGIEFYVCGDMTRRGLTPDEKAEITRGLPRSRSKQAIETYEREHGIQDRLLLTVWAKTNAGLRNLFKLSSRSWNGGFYYKPRIDLSALIEHGEGLMVGTGCADSLIHTPAREGRRRRALAVADRLWEAFGPERLWLEVMPHELYNQALANRFTLDLKARWGAKARLLATQDAHYVSEGDDVYQRMLAAIGERGDREKPLDDCGLPGTGWWMKTRSEMKQGFRANHSMSKRDIREALDNTVDLVAEVETTLGFDKFQYIIPDIRVPKEYVGPYAYMKALCLQGWTWRDIPTRIEAYARANRISVDKARGIYEARLTKELRALKRQKFVAYILFVREVYEWVRSQNIACGPGRGSAAGSIVNYLLGITSVDPVEHTLLFERFISPNRIDMPDIDMDFEDVRRGEIIAHLRQKYGEDCTSQIATVGRLKGKACIRDVSRVLKIPIPAVSSVTASLLERSSGDERASMTIEDSFREIGVCKEFNKRYPKVLKYARHIEGYSKSLGIHAAGVVCAPRPLEEILPMESRDHDGVRVPVTAVDFSGAEGFGLLKLDVLGLRTITVLRLAADEIRRRHGVDVVFETLPLDDPDVLQGFTDHDYAGIFQYDSASADKICSGVGFTHFRDIAAMTALNRPGTARSGLAGHYVARKKNPELMKKAAFHPSVSAITADTLGIIVYQEHVIEIFIAVAGFEPGTADSLRKRIAKKEGDMTLGKERERFVAGAMKKTGMSEAEAGKIMDAITFFGCLPTGTQILAPGASWHPDRTCPIDELARGQRIWSVDEGVLVGNRVKRVWQTGVQRLYEIVTDQGTIRATAGHHWQLVSGEYVETKYLNRGSLIRYIEVNHASNKSLCEVQVGEESTPRAPDVDRDDVALRKMLCGSFSAATVRSVTKIEGQEQTWDIEVAEEPHNYVVLGSGRLEPGPYGPDACPRQGFVCHNSYGFNRSHAVSYGMIAYYCLVGATRLYDWRHRKYISIAKAYREKTPYIACYDESSGKTIRGRVKAYLKTGRKSVWEIVTKSFKHLRCSGDHLVLTDRGYRRVSSLKVGALIASERRRSSASRPEVREKIRAATRRIWEGLTEAERRARMEAAWAERTPELRRKDELASWYGASEEEKLRRSLLSSAAGGFRWVFKGTADDGHKVFSYGELRLDNWLYSNGLEHRTQVHIGGGRLADFECKGVFIEFDGMRRHDEYFRDKYGDDRPYVVVTPDQDFDDRLAFLLEADEIFAGNEIIFESVKTVRELGLEAVMYDVVMEGEPHNFLANNVVVHNCMWLKQKYPLEFYRALLYCEPKYERIQSVAKDAKAHDIEVLPADVSVSGQGFTIDDKLKAIRGSLVDIKGVGEKAARSIMDNQPFVSFWDFLERIDGRAVNKRAVLALALAGALDELLPNVKWFADNIEQIWKLRGRKTKIEGLKAILARSDEVPDYDPEERALVAATVSPLAFGKHPMDAYDDFIAANVPIKIESMGSEDFWLRIGKEKVAGFWICGIIIEIRMNQVGDFHSGAPPSDDEKKRMRWGEQYVNINIEDASGKQCRCKFDWDIFEEYRSIVIDRGRGTPVVVHVTGDSHYQNLLAHGCVDLEQLRKNILAEKKLELWERIVTGRHPLKAYKFKTSERRKLSRVSLAKVRREVAAEAVKAARGEVVVFRIFGMITHVRRKLDKKMKMMGFFGILGIRGYLDVLCFGSLWPSIQKEIRPGRLVEMEVEYNRGQGIYSGDLLRFLE